MTRTTSIRYRNLRLTETETKRLKAILKETMRRSQHQHARSNFVPSPGRFDSNLSRISSCERWLAQLDDEANVTMVDRPLSDTF